MSRGPTKTKTFDCLKFKRAAQAAIYEQIKDMSPAEQATWLEHEAETGPLGDLYRRLKEAQADRRRPVRTEPTNPSDSGSARRTPPDGG